MFKDFLSELKPYLFASFKGKYIVFHIAAIIITTFLVLTGTDWEFYEMTRLDALYPLIMLAGIGGFFVPIVLPFVLYEAGKRKKNKREIELAIMIFKASLIAWIIVAIYKVFTGRIEPEFLTTYNHIDNSHQFQFGFLRYGIFWGWPSHHAAVASAAATVLYFAGKSKALKVSALIWASVVSLGAAVGFHWLSDVVAGVLVGYAVGASVSKKPNIKDSFRKK